MGGHLYVMVWAKWRATNFLSLNQFPARPAKTDNKNKEGKSNQKQEPIPEILKIHLPKKRGNTECKQNKSETTNCFGLDSG